MDSKAVGERQGGALLQIRLDFRLVQLGLVFVRSQNHDNVGGGNGRRHVAGLQTIGFRLGDGRRTRAQAHGHVNAGLFQVARVSVALGAETNDGNFLALDDGKIAILIVVNLHEKPLLFVMAPKSHIVQTLFEIFKG